MNISFSDLSSDDLAECAELFVAVFKGPPWNEAWNIEDAFERLNDFLHSPSAIAIKAESGNRIVGFLIGEIQQWDRSKVFYLKEMCVIIAMQRQGIGRAVMAELKRMLQKRQVSQIYLITHRDSVPSKFYSALEFEENPGIMVMGLPIG